MWSRLGKRSAKMVATLGPASSSPQVIRSMIASGVDVFRLNFSHGTHEQHKERLGYIRSISDELRRPVAVLQDLCGPKIRTSPLPKADEAVMLVPGQKMSIIATLDTNILWGDGFSKEHPRIGTNFKTLAEDVKPGDTILLSDGLIHLLCIDRIPEKKELVCQVIHGGLLKSSQGINLPNVELSTPCVTEKDIVDLRFGLENGVDFVAVSFVRTEDDVLHVKKLISDISSNLPARIRSSVLNLEPHQRHITPVVAKIEKPEALDNILPIIEAADAIMVARGDLGVELPPQQVPIFQKRVIAQANHSGVPVIVATQMLESMVLNPRPTRAEVSDVCNAIFDGADATMLSAETAAGAFPLESLQMMIEIAEIAESNHDVDRSIISAFQNTNSLVKAPSLLTAASPRFPSPFGTSASSSASKNNSVTSTPVYQAIGHAASAIANSIPITAIVCWTTSGDTARMIARDRPRAPVIALTNNARTTRQLNLVRNVFPYLVPECRSLSELSRISEGVLLREQIAKQGDTCIITSSHPIPKDVSKGYLATNFLKIIKVGTSASM